MRILHVGDDFAALRPCGLTLYSEALMDAQAEAGHEVFYFFSGRHYPRLERPRLRHGRQGRVRTLELIGSPNNTHPELGTRHPLRDLDEAAGEGAFAAALREAMPDIVHFQELAGLPSSLILQAKAARLPVAMTLHDYKMLCASVRLFDADGQRCSRLEVGEDCARNCAGAPDGRAHLVEATLRYERRRLKQAVPGADRLDFSAVGPVLGKATQLMVRGPGYKRGDAVDEAELASASPRLPAAGFQRRRDVNVGRLNLCDRLVAPSARTAEVVASLGVDAGRVSVQRLTLPHLERLVPRRGPEVGAPMEFVTLGGCASRSKGSRLVLDAVRALDECGRSGEYRLTVLGHTEPAVREALAASPSISLAGPYEPADLDRVLDRADVGIFPSAWEETHGFVGVEMLAKGLPVIASALGGISEYVIEGETGWLDRSVSGEGLAKVIATALDDRAGVEHLRRSVRARRDEIVRPMAAHVAEVEALYAELVP